MATLNTNVLGATAASIAMTTEKMITLFVCPMSGGHNNHRVTIEVSPDGGTTWIETGDSVNGNAHWMTIEAVATNARAKVIEAEGVTSEVTIHLLAR